MKFTNSHEIIALIEQKKRNGIALRQLSAFMQSINNPQHQLKCIHIGGTNGKGSTTCVCASILKNAGYKVGSFTSPYLEVHHDRIRINDVFIEDEAIVQYANQYYDDWVKYDLSMFEIDMFIAVQYFVDHQVDFAIFEVGLGGEQDATNIIDPLVSAITNIGMDHMEYLGDTFEKIAATKGGIIKPHRMFITTERKATCLQVFETLCKQKMAPMQKCGEPTNIHVDTHLHFDYRGYCVKQPTLASYQAQNTALAMDIVVYLRDSKQLALSDENILKGIEQAIWKGRFEIISNSPLIIIDGAHNLEGIEALAQASKPFKDIRILFSALKDKPYFEMLTALSRISTSICVCEFDFYRAADANTLASNHHVRIIKDFKLAIDTLLEESNQPLLICGSLYFISDVRKYLLQKTQSYLSRTK